MNEKDIKRFLAERFSEAYAFFEEFRPFTGYAGNINQIDAMAVGLYDSDDRVIAFEIKISRNDFFSDVSQFTRKHRFALEISHEFYYVCPWGLVEKNEVPDIAGLMLVDSGNRVRVKKRAARRSLEDMPLKYFQAFARNFGAKIEHAKIPVKFMGKELTQERFKEMISEETERAGKYWIRQRAEELYEKRLKNKSEILSFFDEIAEAAHVSFRSKTDKERKEGIIKVINEGHRLYRIRHELKHTLNEVRRLVDIKDD